MTPYRSGLPVDAIPPPDANDPDQKRQTKGYQSIVGCINWLTTCTRPDISPCLTFLASYSNQPSHTNLPSTPSNIYTATAITASAFILMPATLSKPLTTFLPITIKKHTQMQLRPPRVTAPISPHSVTHVGAAKSIMQSRTTLLLNSSNFAPSPALLSAR